MSYTRILLPGLAGQLIALPLFPEAWKCCVLGIGLSFAIQALQRKE